MLYFKVKSESDQIRPSVRFKNSFLVGGELYTHGEVKYAIARNWVTESFIEQHTEKLNIRPKDTYFFCGARKHKP